VGGFFVCHGVHATGGEDMGRATEPFGWATDL
jgi:hypothetical protein